MAKVQVADSLEEARPHDIVLLNRRGNVIPQSRERLRYGIVVALLGVLGVLGYLLSGLLGVAGAMAYAVFIGWLIYPRLLLKRGLTAALQGRIHESRKIGQALLRSPLLRRGQSGGHTVLALCDQLEGRDAEALAHVQTLKRRRSRWFGRALAQSVDHQEVILLARCGQLAEANEAFRALPQEPPKGEFFRLSFYTAELYLAFRAGRHGMSDDELHDRASFALRLSAGVQLLALLAWAFEISGDPEMADLALEEADRRDETEMLSRIMPDVAAWRAKRSDALPVRVDAAPLHEEEPAALEEEQSAKLNSLKKRR